MSLALARYKLPNTWSACLFHAWYLALRAFKVIIAHSMQTFGCSNAFLQQQQQQQFRRL
jgi:hypothetical protein